MPRVLLDTTCLVAAVVAWHEHHATTQEELQRLKREGATWVVAAHSLAESYAVLTRLPGGKRVTGPVALELLSTNWARAQVVALSAGQHWRELERAAAAGVEGGQLYDALIAACARRAGAGLLLTWNERHFLRFAGAFEVRRPRPNR